MRFASARFLPASCWRSRHSLKGGTAPPQIDRPHQTSRARIRPLVTPLVCLLTLQPGPHDLAVALSVHARTTTTPEGMHDAHDGTLDPGPTHTHRAGTRPCAWPALPHLHPSGATAPHSTAAPFGTSGSAAPLCTAAPLYTSLHRAPLCAALSCTSPCTAPHRCTSLHLSVCALQLPVLGVAPTVQSAGSTHSPSRQVASFVMECLPERPFSVLLRRQGAAAQQGGGQACQRDRT